MFRMSAWQQHYPQTINMMAYNGAEKGCSGTKEELVIELTALLDSADAYLSGEKEFTIFRRYCVENDRWACCPYIAGQVAKVAHGL